MAAAQQDVRPNHKVLFEIIEVPGRQKPVWNEVGVGFVNNDGSINIRLHRKLKPGNDYQLREARTREDAQPEKPAQVIKLKRPARGKK